MPKFTGEIATIRLDSVRCECCRAVGILQLVMSEYDPFIKTFEIKDTWIECYKCGEGYRQLYVPKDGKELMSIDRN